MKTSFLTLFAATAIAAYVPTDPWRTLTPDGIAGPTTCYTNFGIQVETLCKGSPCAQPTGGIVTEYPDGQLQKPTGVVTQIPDGQIQQPTGVVTQIPDGQVQQPTGVVTQIPDGQIQQPTGVVTQIPDGQIQQPTGTPVSQIPDGQIQHDKRSCAPDSALAMTLSETVLTDAKGRIGSIVANRQFQFDGPPPQAGAIYAAGWSITADGYLAIGTSTSFFQCLSDDFYNLYDQSIGGQCEEVKLHTVSLNC